jgi:F-type H+-transporting ATPase subunit epsilon
MMSLRVLLPFGVFREAAKVQRIVVETDQGSFGLWPRRLDCVAAIVPGILLYQVRAEAEASAEGHGETEVYIAVDSGVLVKTGPQVVVSVRHAIAGTDLNALHGSVADEFMQQSMHDKQAHSVFQKMESDFIRRFTAFKHDA